MLRNTPHTTPCGPPCDARRGAVLIMVLIVLAGLALTLAEFSRLVLTDHSASAAGRAALGTKPLLASGERLAARALLEGRTGTAADTMFAPWAEEFPEILRELSLELESADLSGEISDENSRFPLSALFARSAKEQARAESYAKIFTRLTARLLLLHGLAETEAIALEKAGVFTTAVRHWGGDIGIAADPEDSAWYLEGMPSYIPPRTRFLSVGELLLVRWRDMDEKSVRRVILGTRELPGLIDLLSLWSTGPMNINTLHPLLINALVENPEQALAFSSHVQRHRSNRDAVLEKDWYRDEAVKATGNSALFPFDCVGVRSACFRVSLTAAYGAAKAESVGICRVSGGRVRWLSRIFR